MAPIAGPGARDAAVGLIEQFGSLGAVFAARRDAIEKTTGDRRIADHLALLHKAQLHALRATIERAPILSLTEDVADYLRSRLAFEPHEIVHALYLNNVNRLVGSEQVTSGTIDRAPLYPQPILRRAIELGATGLIIAHNHPSGDIVPSPSDIQATEALRRGAEQLGIRLLDHVIVTRQGCYSMRAGGTLR